MLAGDLSHSSEQNSLAEEGFTSTAVGVWNFHQQWEGLSAFQGTMGKKTAKREMVETGLESTSAVGTDKGPEQFRRQGTAVWQVTSL